MRALSIIPARSGSKGLPGKNIKKLLGLPLLAYSIRSSLAEGYETYVSTDCEEYALLAQSYGAKVPFLRPKEISQDESSDLEFMLHFLAELEKKEQMTPDFIIHLRPTTPLRELGVLKAAIESLSANKQATSLLSLHECPETAYKKVELTPDNGQVLSVFDRGSCLEKANCERQSLPKTYTANGVVDVLRPEVIKKMTLHGNLVIPHITSPVMEIDSPWDFQLNELILQSQKEKYRHLLDW